MTTEQFFKYAVEMCQKCSGNGCENVKLCLEDLHVDILPILIFFKSNKQYRIGLIVIILPEKAPFYHYFPIYHVIKMDALVLMLVQLSRL